MDFNFFSFLYVSVSFLWSWLVGPLQTNFGFLGHELTNIDFQTCWSPTLGCIFSRGFSWFTESSLLWVNFSGYTILKAWLRYLYTIKYEHIAFSIMLNKGTTIKFPYLSESSVLFYVSTTPFSSTCERSNSGTASLIPRIFPLTVFIFVQAYSPILYSSCCLLLIFMFLSFSSWYAVIMLFTSFVYAHALEIVCSHVWLLKEEREQYSGKYTSVWLITGWMIIAFMRRCILEDLQTQKIIYRTESGIEEPSQF